MVALVARGLAVGVMELAAVRVSAKDMGGCTVVAVVAEAKVTLGGHMGEVAAMASAIAEARRAAQQEALMEETTVRENMEAGTKKGDTEEVAVAGMAVEDKEAGQAVGEKRVGVVSLEVEALVARVGCSTRADTEWPRHSAQSSALPPATETAQSTPRSAGTGRRGAGRPESGSTPAPLATRARTASPATAACVLQGRACRWGGGRTRMVHRPVHPSSPATDGFS